MEEPIFYDSYSQKFQQNWSDRRAVIKRINSLEKHLDLRFFVRTKQTAFRVGTSILNALLSCCFAREYDRNLEYKMGHGALLEVPRRSEASEKEK